MALVSAGIGLVGAVGGAIVGGAAAARGARLGAQTAADATARQVRDQAYADHVHWLRERRLEAFREFMNAYDECVEQSLAFVRSFAGNPDRSDVPSAEVLYPTAMALGRGYALIRIVGPEAVRVEAAEVRQAHNKHAEHLLALREAHLRENDQSMAYFRSRARTSLDEMVGAYKKFVRAANQSCLPGGTA